jgi:NhaA family Na+:H+ antiporter
MNGEKTMSLHAQSAAPPPIVRIIKPFQTFAANEASGGIVLLLSTAAALIWANSPWSASYTAFWHTNITISLGAKALSHDLHFWVNDLLMVIFFFFVGLEIKREVLVGELASPRQAALPIIAAFGGVVVPAIIYSVLNAGTAGARGWGVPMATDIAFALGVMALLGSRIPVGLKVFLTALAIADDMAAVLVIAVFYTEQISGLALGAAALCLAVLLTLNRLGARQPLVYAFGGAFLWLAVLASGVHATIAGIALAFTIPSRTRLDAPEFLLHGRSTLDQFGKAQENQPMLICNEDQQAAVHALEEACEKVQPPLLRMEYALQHWVTFAIMPVFALANAGVVIGGDLSQILIQPITLGVILGLLIGKPIGITLASWLAVRNGLAALPAGVNWSHIHGAGWLGGIGFTMSLFVASLAFADEAHLTMAKVGIFTASLCAGIVGSLLLLKATRHAAINENPGPGHRSLIKRTSTAP